jgi:glycosyltransferase involved in cell wall biosynthesis
LNCVGTAPFLFGTRRQIMVVHDVNYLLMPESFSRPYRLWGFFAKNLAARRARQVVCFSHHVKETIVERLGIAREKIAVIYQGPGLPAPLLHPAADHTHKAPFFLAVGSFPLHKNLPRVLQAWERVQAAHPGYRLKVIGAPGKHFSLDHTRAAATPPPNVEFTGYLPDDALAALYRHATGLIYPSLREGFGLPVVEAFYLGCPVITSNASCLPEIAGDAALLADPYSVKSIAAAMERLIREPATRLTLIERGLARRRLFTWENAGRQLRAVIEALQD